MKKTSRRQTTPQRVVVSERRTSANKYIPIVLGSLATVGVAAAAYMYAKSCDKAKKEKEAADEVAEKAKKVGDVANNASDEASKLQILADKAKNAAESVASAVTRVEDLKKLDDNAKKEVTDLHAEIVKQQQVVTTAVSTAESFKTTSMSKKTDFDAATVQLTSQTTILTDLTLKHKCAMEKAAGAQLALKTAEEEKARLDVALIAAGKELDESAKKTTEATKKVATAVGVAAGAAKQKAKSM